MGKKHIKINPNGIIEYTDNYHKKMEQMLALKTAHSSVTRTIEAEQMAAATPPDFWGYYEAIESAMRNLNTELYRAYDGKIPLKDYERWSERLFDHQCELKIDIERDELNGDRIIAPTARTWQKKEYSWKEAVIEELKKTYPEIAKLGRQNEGLIR